MIVVFLLLIHLKIFYHGVHMKKIINNRAKNVFWQQLNILWGCVLPEAGKCAYLGLSQCNRKF